MGEPRKSDQAFIFNPGHYYVIYKDGGISQLMPEYIAQNYAAIFGGSIRRSSHYPTLLQRITRLAVAALKAEREKQDG